MRETLASLPPGHPDEFAGLGMPPAQQVRILLARKKLQGVGFDLAWSYALGRVRWPSERIERQDCREALDWARQFFEAAYKGSLPSASKHNLCASLEALTAQEEGIVGS